MDKRDKKIRQLEDERNQLMAENQELKYIINVILSILVDTFISKISFPMQPGPEIGSISDA